MFGAIFSAVLWGLCVKFKTLNYEYTNAKTQARKRRVAFAIKLSAEELEEMEVASSKVTVMGTRYTEAMEKSTGL